jgi:hypothetical protein
MRELAMNEKEQIALDVMIGHARELIQWLQDRKIPANTAQGVMEFAIAAILADHSADIDKSIQEIAVSLRMYVGVLRNAKRN